MKAMNTPAAKAKGMKPETKTMKVMKTPAAKAKGMKPKTEPLAGMKIPAAKAKQMKPETETEIIINGDIRLSTPMGPREILRCILAIPFQGWIEIEPAFWNDGAGQRNQNAKRKRFQDAGRHGLAW